ncbi:phosphatidylglycerophosphatase A [Temperatibacter marinus]|uniref:Phosphatidylglycerophosphatase A n=1 Tax=Temperatibacter marinus TaxID=1456591 RepID=A0AA52EBJ8_9PROT|nr:phosphatidylglycerophosphatase A [Temperatibacter marinus]WND02327.1 phosphatidylglycerophosphatase A [Temperatibacter marinus]
MAKHSLKNWNNRLKSPAYWWSTFFGIGMIKWAPGTWGSLFGAMAGYGLILLGFDWVMLLAASLVVTLLSVRAIDHIEKETGIHDSGEIVIDEVAGQWIAMIPLTFAGSELTLETIAYSFALFRLFDILKPWPIGWLDKKVSGGFGVMVDDIVAGLMAAFCLYYIL